MRALKFPIAFGCCLRFNRYRPYLAVLPRLDHGRGHWLNRGLSRPKNPDY
ncbi:MAG: hypothetical protein Ct9H300mP14_15540 [Gammaproteobacteria bacterium]|nr:MAG: hypothetical protein Ct9H300mP14_15540 [Gammaproteobacteria bacterium]